MQEFPDNGNKMDEGLQASRPMPMKTCPFCGERILAIAKKCKYCGEWLDGYDVPQEPRPLQPQTQAVKEKSQNVKRHKVRHGDNSTSSGNTRKNTINTYLNYDNAGVLVAEIIVLSILTGVAAGSWIIFAISLVILFALLHIRFLRKFLHMALSLMWGLLGLVTGVVISIWYAPLVLGLLGLIVGIAIHFNNKMPFKRH